MERPHWCHYYLWHSLRGMPINVNDRFHVKSLDRKMSESEFHDHWILARNSKFLMDFQDDALRRLQYIQPLLRKRFRNHTVEKSTAAILWYHSKKNIFLEKQRGTEIQLICFSFPRQKNFLLLQWLDCLIHIALTSSKLFDQLLLLICKEIIIFLVLNLDSIFFIFLMFCSMDLLT